MNAPHSYQHDALGSWSLGRSFNRNSPILSSVMPILFMEILLILANLMCLVTSILGLPRIILEDGVVTKLEWLLETWFVSEEELGTENGVPVRADESQRGMCLVMQSLIS